MQRMTYCASIALLRIASRKNKQKDWILDLAEIVLELYYGGRERHTKRVIAPLHAESFGLRGIQETLKDVPACIRFVHEAQ